MMHHFPLDSDCGKLLHPLHKAQLAAQIAGSVRYLGEKRDATMTELQE
jgi:hypothetical protein